MRKTKTTNLSPEQIEYVQQLMKQNHELRQVVLEVLACLSREEFTSTVKDHCKQELNRVLFDSATFLH